MPPLCAGLPYRTRAWADLWPKLVTNAIEACKAAQARLVFFDNVYMYGRVDGRMTEETPHHPCSKKGEIRARLATQIMEEAKHGNLVALIARSADFYGPYATSSSVPWLMVMEPLKQGKRASWLVNADARHSFSYTIDCAKALVVLADEPTAFRQVWHLPTKNPAPTGKEFIELVARELGVSPSYSVVKKWMVRVAGLTNVLIRESYEMLYQSEFDYWFDSAKFERAFGLTPTPYEVGIAATLRHAFKQSGRSREASLRAQRD